jgi:hypothetical protein
MKLKRTFYKILIFSPAYLLGWIAAIARLTNVGSSLIPSDPDGYRDRLQAYAPIVAAGDKLAALDDTAAPSERKLEDVLDLAPILEVRYPILEGTRFGVGPDSDARRPIFRSLARIRHELESAFRTASERHDLRTQARLCAIGLRLSGVMRYSDSESNLQSTNNFEAWLRRSSKIAPRLAPEQLARVAASLDELKAWSRPISTIFRNEFALYSVRNHRWTGDWQRSDAAQIVAEAFKSACSGLSLKPMLDRVSQWQASTEKQLVWEMLCDWQIAMNEEAKFQKQIQTASAELRAEQLRKHRAESNAL